MELKDFVPGSLVEICIARNDEKKEKNNENNIFISTLFDITSKDEVIIHIPERYGRYVSLPLNLTYEIRINTGNKGIYEFKGTITKQGKIEKFPVYVIKPISSLVKIQRRDYYRFKCIIPVNVIPIAEEVALLPNMEMVYENVMKQLATSSVQDIEGTIVDISGGGARFTTKSEVSIDKNLYLTFLLKSENAKQLLKVVARIVKSEYKEELDIYEHRVEFVFKEDEDRETIIKYIFNEDRRLRKKDQG